MEGTLIRSHTLWSRLLVTLAVVVLYRVGAWIPLPGIDPTQIKIFLEQLDQLGWFLSALTGGALERFSLFALGLIPYLNAAIFFSLIAFRSSKLRELFLARDPRFSWGLWALVLFFSLLQAMGASILMVTQGLTSWAPWAFYLVNVPILVAGVFVLIWLGSLINRYGIGHGWAILIITGILSTWPLSLGQISYELQYKVAPWAWGLGVFVLFALVLAGSIWAFQSNRQLEGAKHPVPFLQVGVIPIELSAGALVAASAVITAPPYRVVEIVDIAFQPYAWKYMIIYGVLILLLAYWYKNAILHPQALGVPSNPALGASLFLLVIALLPMGLAHLGGMTLYFLGGTGILIIIGVLLDAYHRAKITPPLVGIYRTFSHVRAHEAQAQLARAGIPSVLRTPLPYSYNIYPMLGPVEIAVSERDHARAEEIVKAIGPEAALRVPPREWVFWAVLVGVALVGFLLGIWFQLSVWPHAVISTALILVLVGLGLFGWLCQSHREYAYWFFMIVLWLVVLVSTIAQVWGA